MSLEVSAPSGFSTTQGQGEDDDFNVSDEEEYCSICEKLIDKNDTTFSFPGSDYIACSAKCKNKGVGNRVPFHGCSQCSRQIPRSIGETCRTCQSQNHRPNEEEDNSQPLHTCPQCRQQKR